MTPGVRQLLMGGGQWRSTLPGIRSYITANYNQPNPHNQAAMAVPPTITASTTAPVGLSLIYRYQDSATNITYTGGRNQIFGGFLRQFPVATLSSTGGNTGGGTNGICWRVGFRVTAAKVGISPSGNSTEKYRFISDTKYVDTVGTLTAASSGANYFQLDYGSSATRDIWIECGLSTGFNQVLVAPGDVVQALPPQRRMIILGDSLTESTGATRQGDGFARYMADMLGFGDAWLSGVGSTGYVANASNTRYTLGQRLSDANQTGPWDVIVVAMGTNDINLSPPTITAEVRAALLAIRKGNPAAQIFVVGGWDANAPGASFAGYDTTKAAIQAGIPSNMGFFYIDPQGVAYTKVDSVHPDDAGHATLGAWLALQIKTAIGA